MSYTLIAGQFNMVMYVANGWGKYYLGCKSPSQDDMNNNGGAANKVGSTMRIYLYATQSFTSDPMGHTFGIYTHVHGFGKWVMTNNTYLDPHIAPSPVSYVDTGATTSLPPNDPKYRYKLYRHADGNISILNLQYGWLFATSQAFFSCLDINTLPEDLPSNARFLARTDIGTGPVMVANRVTNYAPPYQQVLTDNWYYFRDPIFNNYMSVDSTGKISMQTTGQMFQFENYTSLTDVPPAAQNLYRLRTSTGKYVCIDATGPVQLRDVPGEWETFRLVRNDFDCFGEFSIISVAFSRAIYWSGPAVGSSPYTSDSTRSRNQSFQLVPVYQVVVPTNASYGSAGAPPYPAPYATVDSPAQKKTLNQPQQQVSSNNTVMLIRLAFVAVISVFGLIFTVLLAKR